MEWLLLALTAGGAATYTARRVQARRADRKAQADMLDEMRRLAGEDVTVFGEQLRRLGDRVAGRRLDGDAHQDYQTALDAYERGKWDAPRMSDPDQISRLVDTLATGRYALACVYARIEGRPPPDHRLPCFFNPQHGPSARDVMWTSARHGSRIVPACTRCATQVAAHEKPEVRTIRVGSRTVPYWEAGASLSPYSRGYSPAASTSTGAMVSWMYTAPDPAWGSHGVGGGGSFNGGGGFDGGGGDGGGGGGDGGGF